MKRDDEEAFAAFVHRRGDALHGMAWALTRDRQLAEDLVQTALAKTYASWRRISSDDPEAYVRKVMLNAHRNAWRRRLPRLSWRAEVPDDRTQPDFEDAVLDRRVVWQAIAKLSAQQRAVVVLRYYEDRPDDEIARILDCGVGSVHRHATRALRRLEQELGPGVVRGPANPLHSEVVS